MSAKSASFRKGATTCFMCCNTPSSCIGTQKPDIRPNFSMWRFSGYAAESFRNFTSPRGSQYEQGRGREALEIFERGHRGEPVRHRRAFKCGVDLRSDGRLCAGAGALRTRSPSSPTTSRRWSIGASRSETSAVRERPSRASTRRWRSSPIMPKRSTIEATRFGISDGRAKLWRAMIGRWLSRPNYAEAFNNRGNAPPRPRAPRGCSGKF